MKPSVRKPTISIQPTTSPANRCGRIDRAKRVFEEIGKRRNVELADKAAEALTELEPLKPGNYVILSNIYAAVGQWDSVAMLRKLMKSCYVTKAAGYSLIAKNVLLAQVSVGGLCGLYVLSCDLQRAAACGLRLAACSLRLAACVWCSLCLKTGHPTASQLVMRLLLEMWYQGELSLVDMCQRSKVASEWHHDSVIGVAMEYYTFLHHHNKANVTGITPPLSPPTTLSQPSLPFQPKTPPQVAATANKYALATYAQSTTSKTS
ncbi:E motif [Dillenia turbinata]|uniref:E motif n=1 Tax=Dillenia turbinata TaxID=194707 RepID=A0AAN8W2K6_9MAGN